MEPIQFGDQDGSSLMLLEDAGCYFSPNVQRDNILNPQNFKARNDDILLVTYPKSGTHWVSEILSMLVKGSENLTEDTLKHIEYLPSDLLDDLPSQRVLCSHLPYSRIPLDFFRKRVKIVLCVRNPRDVAVSYYKFISNLSVWDYNAPWDGFLSLFLNGSVPYNSWFEHTDTWLKVARLNKHNIHVVFYEDFHEDFQATTAKLAQFLNVEITPDFLIRAQRETSFSNMKSNKQDITMQMSKNGKSPIYRTGRVGDWRKWFTVEQIEQMDLEMDAWGLNHDNRIRYSMDGDL